MTSLLDTAKSYKNRKIEATKQRRQAENKLKSTLSLKRRSSSGLSSLERRKEDTIRKKEDNAQLLNQYLAQRDSIQRLKILADERLRQEQEARDQVQQQGEYAEPAERSSALERLKIIDDKIKELESEIKQRNLAEERLIKIIADLEKQKTKIDADLKKQNQSKPSLLEQLKSSKKSEPKLRSHIQSLIRREEQVNRDLAKITKRLAIAKAAKRKAQRRAASQRKAAAKRRATSKRAAMRRRTAAKRKKQKRVKTRTSKTIKRKASKRKPARRKAPKRETKRKPSKKSKRRKR